MEDAKLAKCPSCGIVWLGKSHDEEWCRKEQEQKQKIHDAKAAWRTAKYMVGSATIAELPDVKFVNEMAGMLPDGAVVSRARISMVTGLVLPDNTKTGLEKNLLEEKVDKLEREIRDLKKQLGEKKEVDR